MRRSDSGNIKIQLKISATAKNVNVKISARNLQHIQQHEHSSRSFLFPFSSEPTKVSEQDDLCFVILVSLVISNTSIQITEINVLIGTRPPLPFSFSWRPHETEMEKLKKVQMGKIVKMEYGVGVKEEGSARLMAHCGLHHTFDENGNEGAGFKGCWSSPSSSHT